MRLHLQITLISAATLLAACIGNKSNSGGAPPPPTLNTMTVTVDTGPTAATGQINHAYVTVKVCVPGSTTQCANIDHVRLDTGSYGLRLVGSVLAAAKVTLTPEKDAQGQAIEECVGFIGGQTWGPVALADVSMAGEVAAKVPVQIMDDAATGAPPPAACGAAGNLINAVSGFGANGLLGVGVFIEDCGSQCVNAATPLNWYYGCTAAGVCTAENVALANQVTNPVAMFAADNNGVIVSMPNLINANGDVSVTGTLTFGIATQADNAPPVAGLTVLGADTQTGYFNAKYSSTTYTSGALPAMLDSGTDSYHFDDPNIPACSTGLLVFVGGYYCPVTAPQTATVVNTGVGVNNGTSTITFAMADPSITFTPGAAAFIDLAGGHGSLLFLYGMPYFYGKKIYIGIEQRVSGSYTGPYYAH